MAKKNDSKPQTFIDINGKRYDAASGKHTASVARVISDVMPQSHRPQPVIMAKPALATPRPAPTKQVMDLRPVHHLKPHHPQPAKTLMRTAVKKPTGSSHHLKAATRTDILAKSPASITVSPKISYYHADPRREAHASHIAQSELVHRFAPGEIVTPTSQISSKAAPAPTLLTDPSNQPRQSLDVFERALAKADAHLERPIDLKKQARLAKRSGRPPLHHRTVSLVAASLAVLLLTGFIAYQNKTALTIRYASAQAGFHITMPNYKQLGFSLGALNYQSGKASMAFNNRVSNQRYTLSQQPSNWDSQTLLDSVVATSGKPYQTLQHQGQTIYIYDNNDATWVNGGILYQLSSQGTLSTSQVLNLTAGI